VVIYNFGVSIASGIEFREQEKVLFVKC